MASSAVVVPPTAVHTASVIFLHGLGDTGHGWAASLRTRRHPYISFVCPTAPTIPVTLNAGYEMPSWFDLLTLESDGPEDEEGIEKASKLVYELIAAEEKKGIPSFRIVLGGFSQGGALAIYSALRCEKALGGVVALSCWLPLHKQFPEIAVEERKDMPLLQCHGDLDSVVPYKWGIMTHERLKEFMPQAQFKLYSKLTHGSNDEEMVDVMLFLNRLLPEDWPHGLPLPGLPKPPQPPPPTQRAIDPMYPGLPRPGNP